MRIVSMALTGLLAASMTLATLAQSAPTIIAPAQIHWSGAGLPKGVWAATVGGDSNGTGLYVQRLKLAPGAKFPPHTHGKTEMVTVLSGTLWVGLGTKFDTSKMKPLVAGSFVSMPAGVPHYAMAKGPVLLEVTGMGPSTTKMVGATGM